MTFVNGMNTGVAMAAFAVHDYALAALFFSLAVFGVFMARKYSLS